MLPTAVLPQRHLRRQLGADQGQGGAPGRHHRLGPPGRRRGDRQAGPGARGEAVRASARPSPRRRRTSPRRWAAGRGCPRLQPVDQSQPGQDDVLRHRQALRRRHPGQFGHTAEYHNAEATAPPAWPWCWPRRRPARTEPDKVRDALAAPGHRVVLRPDQVRRSRAERLQADVGHPDPERQGADRLAEGVGRGARWSGPPPRSDARFAPGHRSTACSRAGCWRWSPSASPWSGA